MDACDLGKFELVTNSRIRNGRTKKKPIIAGTLIGARLTINATGKSKNATGTTMPGLMGSGQKSWLTLIMSNKRIIAAGKQRMKLISAADLRFASMFFIVAPS